MTDVSQKRIEEFWQSVAEKPFNYTAYELSDEHMRALQKNHAMPAATPATKAHFDAWLAEHDRRVRESAWEDGLEAHARWADNDGYFPYPNNPHKKKEESDE